MWKYLLIVKIVKKNYQRNIFYFLLAQYSCWLILLSLKLIGYGLK